MIHEEQGPWTVADVLLGSPADPIVDAAMLNEGAANLAALHEATRNAVRRVVPITRAKQSAER